MKVLVKNVLLLALSLILSSFSSRKVNETEEREEREEKDENRARDRERELVK